MSLNLPDLAKNPGLYFKDTTPVPVPEKSLDCITESANVIIAVTRYPSLCLESAAIINKTEILAITTAPFQYAVSPSIIPDRMQGINDLVIQASRENKISLIYWKKSLSFDFERISLVLIVFICSTVSIKRGIIRKSTIIKRPKAKERWR